MPHHHTRAGILPAGICAVALSVSLACGSVTEPSPPQARYEIGVGEERFVVEVEGADAIAGFTARLEGDSTGVVNGELRHGDGGFNDPWSWHMEPGTVEIVDVTIELCDGRPSMVENDLDYWIGTVGRFCPWGARILGRLDASKQLKE